MPNQPQLQVTLALLQLDFQHLSDLLAELQIALQLQDRTASYGFAFDILTTFRVSMIDLEQFLSILLYPYFDNSSN